MAPSTIVLITGANSGIGYATAKVIASASEKYHVLMASRSRERGETAVKQMQSESIAGTVSFLQLDVNDTESIERAVKDVGDQFGRLDVLVNNAGIVVQVPSYEKQLRDTLNTNVIGAALTSEAFKPLLLKSKNPYLLHISSSLGSMSEAEDPAAGGHELALRAYRMSKAALNMLTVQDAKEYGAQGLKVFSVCPGLVVSNLRGTSEEQRTAGGYALDPKTSGETILAIVEGQRDSSAGKFVHQGGVYGW